METLKELKEYTYKIFVSHIEDEIMKALYAGNKDIVLISWEKAAQWMKDRFVEEFKSAGDYVALQVMEGKAKIILEK